jgi:tetratricopeptide (TPR) repeat protein
MQYANKSTFVKFYIQISFVFVFSCLSLIHLEISGNNGNQKIDSLERELKVDKTKAQQISTLLLLAKEYFGMNHPKALPSALRAYQIAVESGDEEGILNSMLELSWMFYAGTEYAKSLDYALRAKQLAEKSDNKQQVASALNAIGTIYEDFGDYDKSSENHFKSLKLYEQLKDRPGMAHASSSIGVLYYKQKNYQKALQYLNISLDITRKLKMPDGIASNLNSIANVYADQKDFQKALKNYTEALNIAVNFNDPRREGSISLSIGTTYLKMKNFDLSKEYIQRALNIFTHLNNQLRIAKSQVQFGEYYLAIKNYPMGFELAGKALDQSRKQGFKEVEFSAAELLHRLSLSMKDTLKAYHYAILESQLNDSLTSGEKQKTLTKLEAQYQFEKDQADKAIAQQRKDYISIILIILLLSGIIILFLIWGRQKVRVRNTILEKESLKKELDFKNKEMVLNVMSLMKKNELLADLSEKLIKIDHEATTPEGKDTIKKVAKELQKSQEEEIWKEFSLRFKEVHGDFYDKLLAKFPSLGPNDLKLCAFLRLNMSSKDIAALTGQRISSLETARHRLRQKLGISNADVNLITFLSQL